MCSGVEPHVKRLDEIAIKKYRKRNSDYSDTLDGKCERPKGLFLFCFICHFYPPFTRKRIVSLYFGREVRTRLGVAFFEVYGPPVFHIKVGRPVKCLAQGHNKRTCRLVLHNLP